MVSLAPYPQLSNAWDVLSLFLIPIGGGIPAGVLLAKTKGFDWRIMMALYFISDVILALVFEPLLLFMIRIGKRTRFVIRLKEAFKKSIHKTTAHYGTHLGPLALILLAFGVDPMTGRAAAAASGHGFLMGWLLAISGDMIYFSLIMVSTLFLNNILGDGTWTTLIILALMMFGPVFVRKWRERKKSRSI